MPRLTYESLLWGEQPTRTRRLSWTSESPAKKIGQIRRIGYASVKGGSKTYTHDFERLDGRYPYLLRVGSGPVKTFPLPEAKDRLLVLGRVLDIELVDGRFAVFDRCYVCAYPGETGYVNGSPLVLAFDGTPTHAIELRETGVLKRRIFPFVTPHGIEG